jgi:hypothetical protein
LPSQSGIDRHLGFLSSTAWSPRGADLHWKIESARWSDEKFEVTNWQTPYSGNQNEVYPAPESIRPLIATTIDAFARGLERVQLD